MARRNRKFKFRLAVLGSKDKGTRRIGIVSNRAIRVNGKVLRAGKTVAKEEGLKVNENGSPGAQAIKAAKRAVKKIKVAG